MKRILLSVGAIAFVGAIAAGATGAFFTDTETSTGNTFTAGSIDLKVDSTQHYNHMVCTVGQAASTWQPEAGFTPGPDQYPVAGSPCSGTWTLTDLGPQFQFFNFGDVKPADQGENTVSLHIESNSAWACADIQTTANNENGINEPEAEAGDVTADPNGGELAQNVHVFAWLDNASSTGAVPGDNIWQASEPILQQPVALSGLNATTTLTLADGSTGTPLAGGDTSYVGLGWCAGTITVSGPGSWSCDGSTMGNDTQTDSATTTVTFRVEQSRNNASFRCSAPIVVGLNDLDNSSSSPAVVIADGLNKWFMYNDTTDTIDNTLGSFVVGPGTPTFGTKSLEFTLGANPLDRKNIATYQFAGTVLSSINAMSYSAYSHNGSGGAGANESPYLNLNIDFNGSNTWQKRISYVPSLNGSVPQDSWNTFDTINSGNALWTYSGAFWPAGGSETGSKPGSTGKTWASILADYPSARILPADGWLGVRVGEPGPTGYIGNIDSFSITIGGSTKTFDFGN